MQLLKNLQWTKWHCNWGATTN